MVNEQLFYWFSLIFMKIVILKKKKKKKKKLEEEFVASEHHTKFGIFQCLYWIWVFYRLFELLRNIKPRHELFPIQPYA